MRILICTLGKWSQTLTNTRLDFKFDILEMFKNQSDIRIWAKISTSTKLFKTIAFNRLRDYVYHDCNCNVTKGLL